MILDKPSSASLKIQTEDDIVLERETANNKIYIQCLTIETIDDGLLIFISLWINQPLKPTPKKNDLFKIQVWTDVNAEQLSNRQASRQRNLVFKKMSEAVSLKNKRRKICITFSLHCECLRFLFPSNFFPDEVQWEDATDLTEGGERILECELDCCWFVCTNIVLVVVFAVVFVVDDCSPLLPTVKRIILLQSNPVNPDPPVNDNDDDVASDEFWIVLLLHLVIQLLLVFEFPFEYLPIDWIVYYWNFNKQKTYPLLWSIFYYLLL